MTRLLLAVAAALAVGLGLPGARGQAYESVGILGMRVLSDSTGEGFTELPLASEVPSGESYSINTTTISAYRAAFGIKACVFRGVPAGSTGGDIEPRDVTMTFSDSTGARPVGGGLDLYAVVDAKVASESGVNLGVTYATTGFAVGASSNDNDNYASDCTGDCQAVKYLSPTGTDVQSVKFNIGGNGVYDEMCVMLYWKAVREGTSWSEPAGGINGDATLRITLSDTFPINGEFYSDTQILEITQVANDRPSVRFLPREETVASFSAESVGNVKPLDGVWFGNVDPKPKVLQIVERVCPSDVGSADPMPTTGSVRAGYVTTNALTYGVRLTSHGSYASIREIDFETITGNVASTVSYDDVVKYQATSFVGTSEQDSSGYLLMTNAIEGLPRQSGAEDAIDNLNADLKWVGMNCGPKFRYMVALEFFSANGFDPSGSWNCDNEENSVYPFVCTTNQVAPPVAATLELARLGATGDPKLSDQAEEVVAPTGDNVIILNFQESATAPDIDAVADSLDLKNSLAYSGFDAATGWVFFYWYVRNQESQSYKIVPVITIGDESFKPVQSTADPEYGRYRFDSTALSGVCSNLGDDYEAWLNAIDSLPVNEQVGQTQPTINSASTLAGFYGDASINAVPGTGNYVYDVFYPATAGTGYAMEAYTTTNTLASGDTGEIVHIRFGMPISRLVQCQKQFSSDLAVTVVNDQSTGNIVYTVPITGTLLLLRNGDFIELMSNTGTVSMSRTAEYSVSAVLASSYIQMQAAVTNVIVDSVSDPGGAICSAQSAPYYGAMYPIATRACGGTNEAAVRIKITLEVSFERSGFDYGLLSNAERAALEDGGTQHEYLPAADNCYGVMNTYDPDDLNVRFLETTATHNRFSLQYSTIYAAADLDQSWNEIFTVFGKEFDNLDSNDCNTGNGKVPGTFGIKVPVYRSTSYEPSGHYWGRARGTSLSNAFEYVDTSEIAVAVKLDVDLANHNPKSTITAADITITQKRQDLSGAIKGLAAGDVGVPSEDLENTNVNGYAKLGDRLMLHVYDIDTAHPDTNHLFIERVVVAAVDVTSANADAYVANTLTNAVDKCDSYLLKSEYPADSPVLTSYTFVDGYAPVDTPIDLTNAAVIIGADDSVALCRYDASTQATRDKVGSMDYFQEAKTCATTSPFTSYPENGVNADTKMYDAVAIPTRGLPIHTPLKVCIEMRVMDVSDAATRTPGRRLLASSMIRGAGRSLLQADATTALSPYTYLFASPTGASSVYMLVDAGGNGGTAAEPAEGMSDDHVLAAILASVGGAVVVVGLCVYMVVAWRRRHSGDDEENTELVSGKPIG